MVFGNKDCVEALASLVREFDEEHTILAGGSVAGLKIVMARMKRSLIPLPNKHEWSEIILVGVMAGGFSCGVSMLWKIGLDKNAVFAFLGAIVGAAAVVFFSAGQQDRQDRRAAARERKQIMTYIAASGQQIDEHVKILFATESETPEHKGRLVAGCNIAIYTIANLRDYLVQAVRHASHLGFLSRAQLERSIEACDRATNELQQILNDADELGKRLKLESVRSSIANLHNTMNNLPEY